MDDCEGSAFDFAATLELLPVVKGPDEGLARKELDACLFAGLKAP